MKRYLAFLMMLITVLSLFTGCTPDELTLLQLNREVGTLDAYTMTGTLDWDADLEGLLAKTDSLSSEDAASLREMIGIVDREGLKRLSFSYGVNYPAKTMEASYTAAGTELMALKLIGETLYVNLDGMMAMIQRNDTQSIQNTPVYERLAALKGKYLAIPMSELAADGITASSLTQPALMQDSLFKQQAMNRSLMGHFIDFAQTELTGYTTGVVTKARDSALQADVYGYAVTADQVPLMALKLMLHLLDHLDGTEALVTKIVSDPTVQQQFGADADTMKAGVAEAFAELRAEKETYRDQLTRMIAGEEAGGSIAAEIRRAVGTVTFDVRVAKLSGNRYWNQAQLSMNNPSGSFPLKTASLKATVTVDASRTPVITAPASTIPFNTFNDSLPHTLILEPDYSSGTFEAGVKGTKYIDVDMVNINGFWYISIPSLPDHFRRLVSVNGQPMVNGRLLTAPKEYTVRGDFTYVALSVFREAGVTLTWNGEDRTLTLEH